MVSLSWLVLYQSASPPGGLYLEMAHLGCSKVPALSDDLRDLSIDAGYSGFRGKDPQPGLAISHQTRHNNRVVYGEPFSIKIKSSYIQ
jgi:hypothetical protein